MRIAVLFDNFGPYHIARLNAATDVADVLGVELAGASNEYAWARPIGEVRFQRRTLFADGPSAQCGTRMLRGRLDKELTEFGPHAVAVPGWSGRLAFAALQWCYRRNVPAIAMSETTAADHPRRGWREALKRRCVAACSAGLVGGEPHRDYLVQLGMPPARIFVGYDAVDNDHFAEGAAAARRDAVRRRQVLGLPDRYFLAVARFIEEKNLCSLLRAYSQYVNKRAVGEDSTVRPTHGEPWGLVVLGDGALRPKLEQLRRDLGLEGRVHLPGFMQYDELPAYYGLAAAFVHASSVEPWGLVVNEAMAAGLPVLVSDRCGCAPNLVREGENGWTFNPDDVGAMSQGLLRMTRLADGERRRMRAASKAIIGDFGPDRFAAGLRQAAEAAVTQRASSRRLASSLLFAALLASAR